MNQHNSATLLASTHDQLYRLALFVAGSPLEAERLLIRAAANTRSHTSDIEQHILRGLQSAPARYGVAQPSPEALSRAQLDAKKARALLLLIAKRSPAQRLVLGLYSLRAMSSQEIGELLEIEAANAAQIVSMFRIELARTLGYVPADADTALLERLDAWIDGRVEEAEAIDLRGLVFVDAETRELRDGMLAIKSRLPHIMAGLFSNSAPPTLLPQLLHEQAPRRKRSAAQPLALGMLVVGVLALAALIVFGPGLFQRNSSQSATTTATDVLDAAIRRFERPSQTSGVLHERYAVQILNRAPLVIERWYDYASPNRLALELREAESSEPRMAVRSDGRTSVQYRIGWSANSQAPGQPHDIHYRVSLEEAQAALPVLRSTLAPTSFFGNRWTRADISGLYLAQAHAENAALLGQSTTNGRNAWLLRYTTDQLPNEVEPGLNRQVLLSIDVELQALLNITVLGEGGESTAYRPWRVEQIELLDAVPENQWSFPSNGKAASPGPFSVALPTLPAQRFSSLEAAYSQSQQPLLVPQALPEAMRGLVITQQRDNAPQQFWLLYEGEYSNLLVLSDDQYGEQAPQWGEEFTSGDYRYRLARSFRGTDSTIIAQVYNADAPDAHTNVVLHDRYSSPDEREQHLRTIIESLVPLTQANVSQFAQRFVAVPNAGGE